MTLLLAEFTLWGEPKPKERPRHSKRGHSYTPKATMQAQTTVMDAFEFANPLFIPTKANVGVKFDFYRRTFITADLDNLIKLVGDALNGVAYLDDSQVTKIDAERFDGQGTQARTVVQISLREAA